MKPDTLRAADHELTMVQIAKPKNGGSAAKAKRKKGLSERRRLERELDGATSEYVRLKYGRCVTCGSTERLTASHWIPRGKKRVRYDLRNVPCQCASCNNRHRYYPMYLDNWMLKNVGADVMLELTELAKPVWKWSVVELREMLVWRRAELAALNPARTTAVIAS